jgi:hypothetical protein
MFGIFSSAVFTATRTPQRRSPPSEDYGDWHQARRRMKEELRYQLHLRGGNW